MPRSVLQACAAVASLVALSSAQTPPGYSPAVTDNLEVYFDTIQITPPGVTVDRAATANLPRIFSDDELDGTYLLMIVDLDVPQRDNGVINSAAPRLELLHALIPGYTYNCNGSLTSPETQTAPATYRQPSPPFEQPLAPHRYVEFLFEQPANFAVPESQASVVQSRVPFNVSQFIAAAGLAAPIKANYFTVVNTTGAGNLTSQTPTPVGGPGAQFTGAADRMVGNALGAIVALGGALLFL